MAAMLVYVFTGLYCGMTHAFIVGVPTAGAVARNRVVGARQEGMFLTAPTSLGSSPCLTGVSSNGRTRYRKGFSPRSSYSKVGERVHYG